jgi:hypothetical protein
MFTKEEREMLVRIFSDVKINPLSVEAIPLIAMMQSIAKKVFAAGESGELQGEAHNDEQQAETRRKRSRKVEEASEFV